MDFRILGPLEVLDGDRRVTLGGKKQRALLALFLLHANEALSTDRLIDELWAESSNATAAKTVQVNISRLRKALGATLGRGSTEVLVTRDHGYALEVDSDRLDSHRFERLVAEGRDRLARGRPERAVPALEEALSLWRGAPLADLAYEPFAQREVARLEDLRVAALEQLIDAKLALGGHMEVVGQVEVLIAEHPYRERLRAQLMLALYRSDRQADALQAYQDARASLVEELGIEPGDNLRDLERAILAQDPELSLLSEPAAPCLPATAEPRRGLFVGRDPQLAELVNGLDDAFAGHGRLFLLAGEPGIGKSRLAEELASRARLRNARVLIGRCWEAGGAPAYWPWVQALRAYVGASDSEQLKLELGVGATALAQLFPELREHLDTPPAATDPEADRFRLFEATSALLRAATRERPVVLVLDDLHAADEPSLLLLRFIVREIGGHKLLIVGAYRDVDPTISDPLSVALAELLSEPHTSHIALSGLSEPAVTEYIALSTEVAPTSRLADAIHAETEGNPLFMGEVVRLLDAEGRLEAPDVHLGIPPGVRAVIDRRVGRLSERCQDVLVSASVMGREFELDALARLGAMGRDELLDVLDEGMGERVLTDVPGSPGRLRFGHALIRDALYDELTPARRLQLHKEVAQALEALYSADLDPHLAELAHHFCAGAPAGVADKAIKYARRAGDRAATQLAYEEAVRLYGMALGLVNAGTPRCELLLAVGDAQARSGDTPAARQSFREAADLAERLGLPEQLARAALGYGGRFLWEVSRGDADHQRLLEGALAAIGEQDSTQRVQLLARLAGGPLRDSTFPPERRILLSEEALRMARRLEDPATVAYALSGYIAAHQSPKHTKDLPRLAIELVQVATEAGDLERAAEGHEHHLAALIELGDISRARTELAAMATLATELRQPSQEWFVLVYMALLALLSGNLGEAERLIESGLSVGERALGWNARVSYGLQLYLLRREQGRLDEVVGLVHSSAEENPTYPIWRCVATCVAVELGDTAAGRESLDALGRDEFARLPFDEGFLVSHGLLAEAAAALGDAGAASVLYDLLLPWADRIAIAYPEISTGAVARYLGLLSATMERWDDAEDHFEHALELNERIGARTWLARTQRDYARMLPNRVKHQ